MFLFTQKIEYVLDGMFSYLHYVHKIGKELLKISNNLYSVSVTKAMEISQPTYIDKLRSDNVKIRVNIYATRAHTYTFKWHVSIETDSLMAI